MLVWGIALALLLELVLVALLLWLTEKVTPSEFQKASEWTTDSRKAMEKDLLWMKNHPLELEKELESD
jgi:predicted tellurium resistance membrane protein TerC